MNKLVKYFINNSFIVNMLSILMLLVGLVSLANMKRDLISGWSAHQIRVSTTLIGASPSQVENFLTYPIEQSIKGLQGIESIHSTSSDSYMNISVIVREDYRQIDELEQKIKDRVDNLKSELPSETEDISVETLKMTEAWFSSYALTGFDERNDQHQAWFSKFKRKLSALSGVTRISDDVRKKEIYIQLRPQQLSRYRIGPAVVYEQITQSFRLFPIGSINKNGNNYQVEIANIDFKIDEIQNITIKANSSGHKLKLKDIAKVQRRLKKSSSINLTNFKESVEFTIWKDPQSDTITLKEDVEKFLKDEKANLPSTVEIHTTGDGPSFIERQINALKSNSLLGAVLVVITLMIFLGGKNSLMTSFGIPLSYCFTFFVLENLGIKIDLISVIGMLLVLGILVDDAIIVAEQYSQNLEKGIAPKEAAALAVEKTWVPITGTVLTTVVAFMPILIGYDGLSTFLYAIPVVVIASLGVSLFEVFFILPNHLAHFVKKPQAQKSIKFMTKVQASYKKILSRALKFRYLLLPLTIAFMGYSIYFAQKNIPMNFNFSISSEKVKLVAVLNEAKSLQGAKEQLEKSLWTSLNKLDKTRFDYISTKLGRIWHHGKSKEGPQYASISIRFSQLDDNIEANKKYVEDFLNKEIKILMETKVFKSLEVSRRFDGKEEQKDQLIELRLASGSYFSPTKLTSEIEQSLKAIKGLKPIELAEDDLLESWTFTPDMNKLYSHGLGLASLSSQLRNYVSKSEVYEYKTGQDSLSIYTYIEEGEKQSLTTLRETGIILANGKSVKTKNLGTWNKIKKEKSIKHTDLMRSVVLEIPYDKKIAKKEALIKEIEKAIEPIKLKNANIDFLTQDADEQTRKNKKSMSKKLIFALLAIFFVLAVILKSIVQPLLICSAIPFGVIGVIWAFHLQGLELTIMAFIGVIGMAGVVVNDSLILVDSINKMKTSWLSFNKDIIINGASLRLRPIILTSITTLGGVFPMAYGIGGDSGFTKPLAMSMGWGLVFATSLTLFIIPCMLQIQADIMKVVVRKLKLEKLEEVHSQNKDDLPEDWQESTTQIVQNSILTEKNGENPPSLH